MCFVSLVVSLTLLQEDACATVAPTQWEMLVANFHFPVPVMCTALGPLLSTPSFFLASLKRFQMQGWQGRWCFLLRTPSYFLLLCGAGDVLQGLLLGRQDFVHRAALQLKCSFYTRVSYKNIKTRVGRRKVKLQFSECQKSVVPCRVLCQYTPLISFRTVWEWDQSPNV